MSLPAKVDGGAFVLARLDVRADPVKLQFGRGRPNERIGIEGLRNFEGLDSASEALEELVVDGFLDKDARSGRARLAGVEVDPKRRPRDCLVEVGIAMTRWLVSATELCVTCSVRSEMKPVPQLTRR